MSSSSSAPCAACKIQRRKCIQECIFAPYFPPDHPEKFVKVHKVFGASNVAKILNELPTFHREDAVNSLAFEADARLRDPVYGCVGLISLLQHRLKQVKIDLDNARMELAQYIGPAAMMTTFHPAGVLHAGQYPVASNPSSPPPALMPYDMAAPAIVGVPTGGPHAAFQQLLSRDPKVHQQQINQQLSLLETQQPAVFREEQEMIRAFERQQQRHHIHRQPILRLNEQVYEVQVGGVVGGPATPVLAGAGGAGIRFNELICSADQGASPSSALGPAFDNQCRIQIHQEQPDQHHHDTLLLLLQQPHTADQMGRLSIQHHPQQTLQNDTDNQHLDDQKPEQQFGSNDEGTLGCRPSC